MLVKKIINRFLAKQEHKKRVRYTNRDVFASEFYYDFLQRIVTLKVGNIAKVYDLDIKNRKDLETACIIAENDFENKWLY